MGSVNYGRTIKPNHGTETPARAVFVSVTAAAHDAVSESEKGYLTLRFGVATFVRYSRGAVDSEAEYQFRTAAEWWLWLHRLCQRKQLTWVICQDLCRTMTLLDMWSEMLAGRLSTKYFIDDVRNDDGDNRSGLRAFRGSVCLEDSPQFVLCRSARGGLRFVDVRNYVSPSTQEGFGSAEREPGVKGARRVILAREWDDCRDRTRSIQSTMTGLWQQWRREDLGCFGLTAPKLSMSSYRHRFMTHAITPSVGDDVRELERAAYYGGRVEAYYHGRVYSRIGDGDPNSEWSRVNPGNRPTGPIYCYDVRSLYPAVMATGMYPSRLIRRILNPSLADARRFVGEFQLVASVLVNSADGCYPTRFGGDTREAKGRFATTLAGSEANRCIRSGDCESIGALLVYQEQPLFRGWVEYWWGERLKAEDLGDNTRAMFCKMILNSMSGKWAQRTPTWIDRPDIMPPEGRIAWSEYDGDNHTSVAFRSIFGHVQQRTKPAEKASSFPAISACITANGREYVRSILALAPPGSVLYSDTDSVICTEAAKVCFEQAGWVSGRQLGKLRLMWDEPCGYIRGIRDYEFGSRKVLAGVPGHRRPIGERSFECDYVEASSSILSRRPNGRVTLATEDVTLHPHTNGRTYSDDGWMRTLVLPESWEPASVKLPN